jgi:hypothetical protein
MSNMSAGQIGTLVGLAVAAVVLAVVSYGASVPFTVAQIGTYLALGATVGGIAGGIYDYATAPDQINEQDSIADLVLQTSSYAQPIPQIWGRYRLAGNIIWMGPKIEHEHREEAEGGKGGGPAAVSITKTYSVDLAIALCDTLISGFILGIQTVWADNTVIYDRDQALDWPENWQLHRGEGDQNPDATISAALGLANTPGYPYLCYLVMTNYDMGAFPRVPNFNFEVYQDPLPTLPQVLTQLCTAVGLPEEQLEWSAVPTNPIAMATVNVQAVRTIIEPLTFAYRFYLFESGLQIVGRSQERGDEVAHIPEGALDATDQEDQETTGLQIPRARERALPTQFSVNYVAPNRGYQQSTQQAMIGFLPTAVEQPRAVSTVLALDDGEAKDLAQQTLDQIWIERTSYQFTVGRPWAFLEPGDRITVESREALYTINLGQLSYGRPGLLECQGRGDSAAVMWVPGAAPGTGPETGQELDFLDPTLARFLALPALTAEDTAPRLHWVYTYPSPPATQGWPGGSLYDADASGQAYTYRHTGTLEGIWGDATTALPDAPAHWTDTTSVVTVVLHHGSLTSITPEAFQFGGNLALLGSELVQFREAVLVAPDTYELRHFWRGRRGTEWATGTHMADEPFTVLDQSVYRLEMPLAWRAVLRAYKTVTRGLSLADANAQTHAAPMENLTPWTVATLHLTLQTNGDWLFAWRGRARFPGAWVDGSQATPDPDLLTYRVLIYTDATRTTLARAIDVPEAGQYQLEDTYVYTVADQTSDFGAPQTTLEATVVQVGRNGVSRAAAAEGA